MVELGPGRGQTGGGGDGDDGLSEDEERNAREGIGAGIDKGDNSSSQSGNDVAGGATAEDIAEYSGTPTDVDRQSDQEKLENAEPVDNQNRGTTRSTRTDVAAPGGATDTGPGADLQNRLNPNANLSGAAGAVMSAGRTAGAKTRDITGRAKEAAEGAARKTGGSINETAGEAAGKVTEPAREIAQNAASDVTPHAGMALDEDGLEARAEREEEFADRAEQGWSDITSGELPSKEEAGALLFQGSEIAERSIGRLGENMAESSMTQGMGPELGNEPVGSIPGNVASGFVGGIGMTVGAVGQVGVTGTADLTGDATYEGETPTEAGGGITGLGMQTAQSQVEMFQERPGSSAILFALPAAEGVPAGVRGYRATRGASETVKFSDITSQRGEQGNLPHFETSPDAPTRRAVGEVQRRAGEQPDAAQSTVGTDQILWHSTEANLGPEFTAAQGGSELPGLFTSPDASPLRLSEGAEASSLVQRLRPGRPDLSTTPDRLAAFEGDRIAGMPDWATGSGRTKQAGEWAPDPNTSGARFLNQQADPGTAYVRSTGSRTTELEAIFSPGSQFAQSGRLAVEMPSGRKIPGDVFRRTGESAEPPGSGATTAGEISSSYTTSPSGRAGPSSVSYTTAFGGAGGSTTPPGSEGPTSPTDVFGQGSSGANSPADPPTGITPPGTSGPTSVTDVFGGSSPGGSSGGSSGRGGGGGSGGSGPPTSPPNDPTGSSTSGTPTEPPSSPFRGSPTGTPTDPPTDPPERTPLAPFGGDGGDDDDIDGFGPAPTGAEFQNPVASGAGFLFGNLGGGGGDSATTTPEDTPEVGGNGFAAMFGVGEAEASQNGGEALFGTGGDNPFEL